MSKYSIQRILMKEELVGENSICTAIMNNGLKFFLYPYQFLGRVLKHRSSIKGEEHMAPLIDGVEKGGSPLLRDTYCFVLASKK